MVDLFGRSCFHFRDRCIVRLISLIEILLGFDLPVPSCLSLARRWLMLCPIRKNQDQSAKEPNEFERNSIRNDPQRVAPIRTRLSNVSWWMRLLCQNIGSRAGC